MRPWMRRSLTKTLVEMHCLWSWTVDPNPQAMRQRRGIAEPEKALMPWFAVGINMTRAVWFYIRCRTITGCGQCGRNGCVLSGFVGRLIGSEVPFPSWSLIIHDIKLVLIALEDPSCSISNCGYQCGTIAFRGLTSYLNSGPMREMYSIALHLHCTAQVNMRAFFK